MSSIIDLLSQLAFYGSLAGLSALAFVNRRSLPLGWHIRLFSLYYYYRIKAIPFFLPKSHTTNSQPPLRLDQIPLGQDIFKYEHVLHLKASYDDCDFWGHMSNSSYPKAMDFGRMAMSSRAYMQLAIDGAWIALRGTQFTFLKEIPIGKRYQLRLRLETWDDKWLYAVGRFTSKNKKTGEEVLHCIGVSKMCIKAGRKTIPPWLGLATGGWSNASSNEDNKERSTSNWEKSEAIRKRLGKVSLFKAYVVPNADVKEGREPWMEKQYWATEQWEEQRLAGFARITAMTDNDCPLATS